MLRPFLFSAAVLALVGCQSLPKPESAEPAETTEKPKAEPSKSSGVVITPYEQAEIKRQKLQVVVPEQKPQQKFEDGRSLPAFKQLMQQTQTAYQQGRWNDAEAAALRAQRIAPQAAETYLFLALVANQKNQPANAEALARRGLSYAQTQAMKKQLWLAIAKAGQKQNNPKTVQQAQQALKSL